MSMQAAEMRNRRLIPAIVGDHVIVIDVAGRAKYHGHAWAVIVKEPDGRTTASCTQCHCDLDAAQAEASIQQFQTDFTTLDATVQRTVAAASKSLQGVRDANRQALLKEARDNMAYAESDESSGFHNHNYLMALLGDANQKALEVLKGGR